MYILYAEPYYSTIKYTFNLNYNVPTKFLQNIISFTNILSKKEVQWRRNQLEMNLVSIFMFMIFFDTVDMERWL